MTSDETQIQILTHWPMSRAKHVTRDNKRNPEYHVAAVIRKQWTDTVSHRKIMAKPNQNEQHIGSEKTYGPKKYWKNIMMQRTANKNASCLRSICKRCDGPKKERAMVPTVQLNIL